MRLRKDSRQLASLSCGRSTAGHIRMCRAYCVRSVLRWDEALGQLP
jgi:hypothetical protein